MSVLFETMKIRKMPVRCPQCQARLLDSTAPTVEAMLVEMISDISQLFKNSIFIKCRKCHREVAVKVSASS